MNNAQKIFCQRLSDNLAEIEIALLLWKSLFADRPVNMEDVKDAYWRNQNALKLLKEMKMTIECGLLQNLPASVDKPFSGN
jgi:hypothetical protein